MVTQSKTLDSRIREKTKTRVIGEIEPRLFFSCYIYIFFKFSYNLRSIQINHNYFLLPDVIFNGRDRNDLAPNINSNLSNVCSIKVECYLRGCCAGRGLELF